MKIRAILMIQTLAIVACVAQLQTIEPTPTTILPPTDIPTLVPSSATIPVHTATSVIEQPTVTATLAIAPSTVQATIAAQSADTAVKNPYTVILVSPGDVLNIRTSAGVANPIAGTLPPTAKDVSRTGPASTSDGDRWVEIQSAGGNGWVNAKYLTEQVNSSGFCSDANVNSLLGELKKAMLNSNG